jgi:hypothetical protein
MTAPVLFLPKRTESTVLSLDLFPTHSARAHSYLLSELRSLPAPLSELLLHHYETRIDRGASAATIPWMVADLFDIKITPDVEAVAHAWLLLHLYTLFLDDFLDEPDIATPQQLALASQLCFHRSITKLYALVPTVLVHSSTIIGLFDEAITAVNEEVFGSGPYSPQDPSQIYKKMSTLKIWAVVLLHMHGRDRDIESYSVALHNLLNAFQLLDDIRDWKDDWCHARSTYLIATTMERLRAAGFTLNSAEVTLDEILAAIVSTSAYTDTLDLSSRFLESTLNALDKGRGSATASLLFELIDENNETKKTISGLATKQQMLFKGRYDWEEWRSAVQRLNTDGTLPKIAGITTMLLAGAA